MRAHAFQLEEAATNVAEELTRGGPENDENEPPGSVAEEKKQKIQVLLTSDGSVTGMRQLKSDNVSRLIKVSGIVIGASAVRAKATLLSLQVTSRPLFALKAFYAASLCSLCSAAAAGSSSHACPYVRALRATCCPGGALVPLPPPLPVVLQPQPLPAAPSAPSTPSLSCPTSASAWTTSC